MKEHSNNLKEITKEADEIFLIVRVQLDDNYRFLNKMKEELTIADAEKIIYLSQKHL